MESETEEECVEVAAFISKTNSEFLRAAAAPNNDQSCRILQVVLVTSRLFWEGRSLSEGRGGGKTTPKRCGVGVGRAVCTQVAEDI